MPTVERTDGHEGRGHLSAPRLRHGTPERAGLDAGELRLLVREIHARVSGERPWAAGAVVVVGRGPVVAVEEAAGWAVRYARYDEEADAPVELPERERVPMTVDTLFDLASLTKLFTSVAAVQQIERRTLGIDARVGAYLPDFTGWHGAGSPCGSSSPIRPGCGPNSRCTTARTTRSGSRCYGRSGPWRCRVPTATPTSTCCCFSMSWSASPGGGSMCSSGTGSRGRWG
ncbi:hypothetical protein SHKM778_73920 [Streptomyces sp. KM77-8]|uniref:Beta-lactamase-related domain-containing protein n=1 Tax=Streptomyces haneummycinicus TaxID=3074435 RepID=A0AAT9HTU5_9ACTN